MQNDNVILINASAGCGKTELMSDIFIYLTLNNYMKNKAEYDFSNILALTFTNTGVNELKERITNKISTLSIHDINELIQKLQKLKIISNSTISVDNDLIEKLKKKIYSENYKLSVYTFDSFYKKLLHLTLYEISEQSNFKLIVDEKDQKLTFKKIVYNFLNFNEEKLKDYIIEQLEGGYSTNYVNNFIKLIEKIHTELFYKNRNLFKELSLSFLDELKNKVKNSTIKNNVKDEIIKFINKTITQNKIFVSLIKFSEEYKKENKIKFLQDVTYELKQHTKDYNFIFYEKLDTTYNYILIDEFQDTSEAQYEIIHEFISEIISKIQEPSVFIVGDSKQSIFRWRNGDWELITHKLANKYKLKYTINNFLIQNYRSRENIVRFNNNIFEKIKDNLKSNPFIEKVYSNISQSIIKNNIGGWIKFISNIKPILNDISEEDAKYLWLIDEINFLLSNNIKDIAILVRKNNEANEIYDFLIKNLNKLSTEILVFSENSFILSKSPSVKFIVYFIAYILTKNKKEEKNTSYFKQCAYLNLLNINNYDYNATNNIFEKIENEILNYNFSLLNLNEQILLLKSIIFNNCPTIRDNSLEHTFVDNLIEFANNQLLSDNYSNVEILHQLIEDEIDNYSINTLDLSKLNDSIKILTIHKVKGESFDAVIIPDLKFLDSSRKVNKDKFLIYTNQNQEFNVYFEFQKTIEDMSKFFTDDTEVNKIKELYDEEIHKDVIDNINLFYVACTRPREALIINYNLPHNNEKANTESKENDKKNESILDKIKEIIISTLMNKKEESKDNYSCTYYYYGKIFDNFLAKNQIPLGYSDEYYVANPEYNITFNLNSPNIKYTFTEEQQSKIDKGKMIHNILTRINNLSDFNDISTKITDTEIQETIKRLAQIVTYNHELKDAYKNALLVINEQDLYYEGSIYRPDKIFILNNKTIVIDFKTGSENVKNYADQIKKYIQILQNLDFNNITGYIINIDLCKVLKI